MLQCLSNGRWSTTSPFCIPISCNKPTGIENGHAEKESNTYLSTVKYVCDKGM